MVQLSLKLDYTQAILRPAKPLLPPEHPQPHLMNNKSYKQYVMDAQGYYPRLLASHPTNPACKPPTNNQLEGMINTKRYA